MSEYWKSTPSYWCKFCAIYVKDTSLERRNHEASGKHQNSIQRSLRDLHKNKEREEREKQRAKDEVARLNGLVSGKGTGNTNEAPGRAVNAAPAPPKLSAAQQRKAHAEQLVAMGVELPEELKREITGVGSWETVSERVIEVPRSLADIKREGGIEASDDNATVRLQGIHKRKIGDEDEEADVRDEEAAPKPRAWGSKVKTYPGSKEEQGDDDLDALLSGVTKKKTETKAEELATESMVKEEPLVRDEEIPESLNLPEIAPNGASLDVATKQEGVEVAPTVVFKKRKIKK